MKSWYIKQIQERLRRHFTRNFARIAPDRFEKGIMRYNFQCHRNAGHDASNEPGAKVHLVFAVSNQDESFCLHVINELPSGKFQDNTWGYEYSWHSYYHIKEILPDQYHRVSEFFDDHRKDFIKLFSRHWLVRLLGIQPTDIF